MHSHKCRIKLLHTVGVGTGLWKLISFPVFLNTEANMDVAAPPDRVLCTWLEASDICSTSEAEEKEQAAVCVSFCVTVEI